MDVESSVCRRCAGCVLHGHLSVVVVHEVDKNAMNGGEKLRRK